MNAGHASDFICQYQKVQTLIHKNCTSMLMGANLEEDSDRNHLGSGDENNEEEWVEEDNEVNATVPDIPPLDGENNYPADESELFKGKEPDTKSV